MQKIDKFAGEFEFLSNFHPSPFEYKGLTWPTVEHAFQAMKTVNPVQQRAICGLLTPGMAKREGRRVDLRSDWEEVKDQVMLDCLRLKFAIPELREKLIATGNAELIEGNTWGDRYWGVCEGVGENHLGTLLMQVREEVKGEV